MIITSFLRTASVLSRNELPKVPAVNPDPDKCCEGCAFESSSTLCSKASLAQPNTPEGKEAASCFGNSKNPKGYIFIPVEDV